METVSVGLMSIAAVVVVIVMKRRELCIASSVMAGINAAGIVGLGAIAVELAIYDGSTAAFEQGLCLGGVIALVAATFGGVSLERSGKRVSGALVLALGAVPVLAGILFAVSLWLDPPRWN